MKELKTPVQRFIEQLEAEKCEVYKGGRYIYTIVNPNGVKGTMNYKPLERLIEIDYQDKSYISIDIKKKEVELVNKVRAIRYEKVYIKNAYHVLATFFSNLEG